MPEIEVEEVSETKTEVEVKEKPTVKLIPHKTRVKVEFEWSRYSTILKIQSVEDVKDGSLITLEGDADLKFFLSKGEKKAEEFRRTFEVGINEDNDNAITKTTFTILD